MHSVTGNSKAALPPHGDGDSVGDAVDTTAGQRAVTWNELLLGAVMLLALVLFFVPVLVLYTVLFGIGAVMRLLDLATATPPETA